jgi:heme-degrading monooxygenase HmoA
MIKRIWHGWTTPENADRYEALLREEVFVGIDSKDIPGYRGIELLRRDVDGEVEFVTIMTFDSLDSARAFVGEDYTRAYVPPPARKVLSRFDERACHYEVRDTGRGSASTMEPG